MKITIWIALILSTSVLPAQNNRDSFIASVGLEALSESGKDILYYYTNENMPNTFWLPNRMSNKKTIAQTKAVFIELFKDRMRAKDLEIISNYWDEQQKDFAKKTLTYEGIYASALDCQKTLIDSLLHIYSIPLQSSANSLNSSLSDNQLTALLTYYEKRLPKYQAKKQAFLDYEMNFTYSITKSIYEYMDYGFGIMDNIPASYYLDLVNGNRNKIAFINKFKDHEYVLKFKEFEANLETSLSADLGCRAHAAIPFYHSEIADKEYYSTLNALLFAHKNKHIRSIELLKTKIEWPNLNKLQKANAFILEDIIDYDRAADLKFTRKESPEGREAIWFFESGSFFEGITFSKYSSKEANKEFDSFSKENEYNEVHKLEELGMMSYYVIDDNGEGPIFIKGFLFKSDKVLRFECASMHFEIDALKERLSIIK